MPEEEEVIVSKVFGYVVIAVLFMFVIMFIGTMAYSTIYPVDKNLTMERYNRVIQLSTLHEFNWKQAGSSWGINENMTIKDARAKYFAYEGYARPIGEQLITWVCDGSGSGMEALK